MLAATDRRSDGMKAVFGWRRFRVLCAVVVLAGGCATLPDPQRANLASESGPVQSCAAWFGSLDEAVDAAGVRDAGAYRVPGFPYLRVNRLLASLRDRASEEDAAFSDWVDGLLTLGATGRRYELLNLPEARVREIGATGMEDALARSEACARELARRDLSSPDNRARLLGRAAVPDDYSDLKRGLGLYALVRIPFASGVARWHEEAAAMFRQDRDGSGPPRNYRRYGPPEPSPLMRAQAVAILKAAPRDALGIPRFSNEDRERLFAAFAPVFEIDTQGPYDRFGSLVWGNGPAPDVDASRPTVYRRVAFTRYGGQILVQLVHTIWFSERPSAGSFDLLAGKLDGVVLRVTLTPEGEPLVYDSIHPCGCFHMFFPTALAQPVDPPDKSEEWAFMPATLPAPHPEQRISVRIASGTHYVVGIAPVPAARDDPPYAVEDEDELRSVSAGTGNPRSIYGPDGLVPGTERGERMLFWPMGIDSAGAMRQWGRHATAFLGRRHFDDADLVDRRFRIKDPSAAARREPAAVTSN